MSDFSKSVFISFRTEHSEWQGDSLYNFLSSKGYSVFYSPTTLGSGEFGPTLIEAISKAGHFVVILAPDTLKKCSSNDDWVRKEIEAALDYLPHMNIIPFLVDGFDFRTSKNDLIASGRKVQKLQGFNYVRATAGLMKQACNQLKDYLETCTIDFSSREAPEAIKTQTAESNSLVDGYRNEALIHYNNGEYKKALNLYTKGIALDPLNAPCFLMRGLTHYRLKENNKAREDFLKAIQFDRHEPVAYASLGLLMVAEGDIYTAFVDFNIAITLDDKFSRAYFHRANVLWKMDDLTGALRDFDKFAALDGPQKSNNETEFNQLYRELKAAIEDRDKANENSMGNIPF